MTEARAHERSEKCRKTRRPFFHERGLLSAFTAVVSAAGLMQPSLDKYRFRIDAIRCAFDHGISGVECLVVRRLPILALAAVDTVLEAPDYWMVSRACRHWMPAMTLKNRPPLPAREFDRLPWAILLRGHDLLSRRRAQIARRSARAPATWDAPAIHGPSRWLRNPVWASARWLRRFVSLSPVRRVRRQSLRRRRSSGVTVRSRVLTRPSNEPRRLDNPWLRA